MNARQSPLAKLEAFMQRVIESPFNRLFPSKMEPIEITRKLERAMDDNTMLQGEGRRLSPNVYDVYLSIKDHQQMSPGQNALVRDWQNHLVDFAKRRHYTLKTVPIIRLHSDTSLRPGMVRIDTEQADQGSGLGATQALSPEQLAQIRAQLAPGQSLPGIDSIGGSSPNQGMHGRGSHSGASHQGYAHQGNSGGIAPTIPPTPQAPPMPQAWLTIRLPQAGQQTYRIEKPLVNIGRQLSNDIIVEDKRVSRYHAQIKFQPDGQFAIFDLGSTNGITINNTPHMRQHILRNGDQFTIGSYDFYFERR